MFRNPATGAVDATALRAARDEITSLRSRADDLERAVGAVGASPVQTPAAGGEAASGSGPLYPQTADPTLQQILAEIRVLNLAVERIAQQATSQAARVAVVDESGPWPTGGTPLPQGWQQVQVDAGGTPVGVNAWDPWSPQRPAQSPFIALIPNANRLAFTTAEGNQEVPISSLYPQVQSWSQQPSGFCLPGDERLVSRAVVSGRELYTRSSPSLVQLIGVVTYQLITDRWVCHGGWANWENEGLHSSTNEVRRRMTIVAL